MNIQLRWLLTHATATPRLQFRECQITPHWGDWKDVPMVMIEQPQVSTPSMAEVTAAATAAQPKVEAWLHQDGAS